MESIARYNPRFTISYNNPDRRAPNETVNKIFSKIGSGRYSDMLNVIMQERSLLNLVDPQNKTVIHYILTNADLSKNDKYDLIKAALDLGAPVDTPDTNGVRPLHLAAGQQNRKVVKLLLQKKAEVNSKTANHLTPLHYAVTPEIKECKDNRKTLIPDTEKIQQGFRTDELFNNVFEMFRDDPTILMYISHISSIFANRFVYSNVEDDANEFAKMVRDTINEKQRGSSSDSLRDKLIDFRNSLHAKTKGDLARTNNVLDIKENIPDGWAPTINGVVDQQLAVLPFLNLKSAFSSVRDPFMKSVNSVIGSIIEQMKRTIERVNKMKKYITDANEMFYQLRNVHDVLRVWQVEINTHFQNDNREFKLQSALNECFNINGLILPVINIPEKDIDNNNFNNIICTPNHDLARNGIFNHFNNYNYLAGPTPIGIGLGAILDNYYRFIEQRINNIGTILTRVSNEIKMGTRMQNHSFIFIEIGNIHYLLTNVCYVLMHFDEYAKFLSSVIDNFRAKISGQNLIEIIEYVSAIINECITRKKNNQTTHYHITKYTGGAQIFIGRDIISYAKDRSQFFVCNDPINAGSFIFFRHDRRRTATTTIANINAGVPIPDGKYIEHHPPPPGGINFMGIIPNNNTIKNVMNIDLRNLEDRLTKLIESGGYNREDQISGENVVNNLYDAIQTLQTKIFSLIATYNMANGYNYSNVFNNNMDDDTYKHDTTENFVHMMLSQIKNTKAFPSTFRQFSEIYKPMLEAGGDYSVANGLATAKLLINTYCQKVNDDKPMMIISETYPGAPLPLVPIGPNNGVITNILTPGSSVAQPPNNVILGYHAQIVVDSRNYYNYNDQKSRDLPDFYTIIGSIFDVHIYMIKLIVLMYSVQSLAMIFDWGTTRARQLTPNDTNLYNAMKNMHDQITELSSTNPLGTLLAVCAKMIDSIFMSTINNISILGASNYIKYLRTKEPIQNIPFDSLLASEQFGNFDKEKRLLIIKPDDRTRMRDKELLLSVVSSSLAGSFFRTDRTSIMDALTMFKTGSINNVDNIDNDNNANTQRIIDFDSTNVTNDACYKIDEDIISELLSAGANINAVGRSGETPLSLAVTIQNENIIETLVRSGATINIANRAKNIYDECFEKLLNSIESSPIMEVDEIDTRVKEYIDKKTDINNSFSNNKLIMRMTAYLFVHQIALIINTYPNMWNRDEQKGLLSMLNLVNVDRDIIPLAKMDDSGVITESIKGYATINEVLDEYKTKLTTEYEIRNRLKNSIDNLNAELRELRPTDTFRKSEIDQLIAELTNERLTVQTNIDKWIQKHQALLIAKTRNINAPNTAATLASISGSNTLHRFIVAVQNKKNHDVCNIYDVFFKDVLNFGAGALPANVVRNDVHNSEYVTYLNMWSKLIARPEEEYLIDHTQVPSVLMKYILKNGRVSPEIFVDAYTVIHSVYDKVLSRYGRDLLELLPYLSKDGESYYESNYVLKQIYCIMYHVFKHTMSFNFVITVAQFLARKDKGQAESAIMRNVYRAMVTSEFIKYCMETLPKLVIKSVCKIAESEKDPDLSLTTTDILNKALDRLLLSTFESVDKTTIELAKEVIVPFFVVYMEAYTAEMHSFMIKQCKMMIVQGRLLKILSVLAPKAIREKIE